MSHIVGVMLGTARTERSVLTEKEVVEGEKTTIYERYEALNTGMAIRTDEIGKIHSNLLGKSIRDHLEENQLVQAAKT